MLTLKEKYKSVFASDANSFGRLIFTSDSKNRLLAMFMGIVAALIALTISTGVNIYSIFIFFENSRSIESEALANSKKASVAISLEGDCKKGR